MDVHAYDIRDLVSVNRLLLLSWRWPGCDGQRDLEDISAPRYHTGRL